MESLQACDVKYRNTPRNSFDVSLHRFDSTRRSLLWLLGVKFRFNFKFLFFNFCVNVAFVSQLRMSQYFLISVLSYFLNSSSQCCCFELNSSQVINKFFSMCVEYWHGKTNSDSFLKIALIKFELFIAMRDLLAGIFFFGIEEKTFD